MRLVFAAIDKTTFIFPEVLKNLGVGATNLASPVERKPLPRSLLCPVRIGGLEPLRETLGISRQDRIFEQQGNLKPKKKLVP